MPGRGFLDGSSPHGKRHPDACALGGGNDLRTFALKLKNDTTSDSHNGTGAAGPAAVPRELLTAMDPERTQQPPTGTVRNTLGKHLEASLRSRWRRYRTELKHCQKHFSEASVHGLRVETRRLLSEVELLGALIADDYLEKLRRELKARLDSFDDLRDTQVHLRLIKELRGAFPELKALREELRAREKRLIKRVNKKVKRCAVAGLAQDIATLRRQVKILFAEPTSQQRYFDLLISAVNRAHADAVALHRRIVPSDAATIHQTRVAFKKFRYMAELLQPVLPLSGRRLQEMRDDQALMGDIQDVEVFLARMDKLVAKKRLLEKPLQPFRRALLRRQKWTIKKYLRSADALSRYCPERRIARQRAQTR